MHLITPGKTSFANEYHTYLVQYFIHKTSHNLNINNLLIIMIAGWVYIGINIYITTETIAHGNKNIKYTYDCNFALNNQY